VEYHATPWLKRLALGLGQGNRETKQSLHKHFNVQKTIDEQFHHNKTLPTSKGTSEFAARENSVNILRSIKIVSRALASLKLHIIITTDLTNRPWIQNKG
jgi:hypothetical protein